MKQIPDYITRRLEAIGRNEPDEAETIMRELVYAIGYCPSSTAHYLIMLQDDQEAFRRRIHGLRIQDSPNTAAVC